MKSEPAKRQTRSVQTQKNEPVNIFFNHYIQILQILNEGKKGVNEIFRQVKELRKPGIPNLSSKPFTTEAISHLEKEDLIKQSKEINLRRKRQRRQKKNMELTEFGSELSKLIRGIEQYTELLFQINIYY